MARKKEIKITVVGANEPSEEAKYRFNLAFYKILMKYFPPKEDTEKNNDSSQ